MHVTYIHQHFCTPKGSFGTRSYEFAQRLIAAGHSVSMICGVGDRTADDFGKFTGVRQFEVDGIDVHCIASPYSNSMGFYSRIRAYGDFARRATKVARGIQTDLVFATSTPLSVGIPGMKAAKHHRVPFVFEVRDLWPKLPIQLGMLKNPLLKAYAYHLEKKIYFSAAHIIGLSPGMKEGICETGYPEQQVTMIPNGCDLDLFTPSSRTLEDDRFGDPNSTRFAFTGAHGRANGLDAVLDAAQVLKKRNVTNVQLVFIGLGSERDRLMQRSKDEGTDSFISWVEAIPKKELAEVLPQMDVGMMILKNLPSFYYGTSPNKFFDYISSGLPVLNNYPGWVADMINENDCGVAVKPDDPEAFADAVVQLANASAEERRAMGARGRLLAKRSFSRDDLAAQFLDVIESTYSRSVGHARVPVGAAGAAGAAGASVPQPLVSGQQSPAKQLEFQVIGSGGHAKVVVQTIRAAGHRVERIFDDDEKAIGTKLLGVPVTGPVDQVREYADTPTVIAIGNNQVRSQISAELECNWQSVVHPSAVIDPSATIGEGSVILAGCVVQADAKVGQHVIMNTASTVDHDSTVGDFCHLCPGVHLAGDVHIAEGVMMGVASSAIPGTYIGEWSTVGSGATVVNKVPANVVAVGVPARFDSTTNAEAAMHNDGVDESRRQKAR